MKEELAATENKAVSSLSQSPVQTRVRVSRTKENPRTDTGNGTLPGLQTRPKPVLPDSNNAQRTRKSVFPHKLRHGSEDLGSPKDGEMEEAAIVGRPRSRVGEQYARLRRRSQTNLRGAEEAVEDERKELQQRLDASQSLVTELHSEISMLKAQMEKMQSFNLKLELQNKRLGEDLSAAEAKISVLEKQDQLESVKEDVRQQLEFKDARKLIAIKLENLRAKKEAVSNVRTSKVQPFANEPVTKSTESQPKHLPSTLSSTTHPIGHSSVGVPRPPPPPPPSSVGVPPPPPPPLPSRGPLARGTTMQRAPALLEFYHSLTKRDREKGHLVGGNCNSPNMNNAHSSIVGEIQNRSAHLLAIKADVETKQDFIKFLIERVQSAAYADIEDALAFVHWLDKELSVLSDERAVLKHFNWPERKADAMREAAFTYRDLKQLQFEISSFQDDASMPCEAVLKKATSLLDKSERSVHRLIKSRDALMLSYKDLKIPTDWMLDLGMVAKIKLASVKLAKLYMKRVSTEIESILHSERESTQETLLIQGVRFAYRVHQFAGGLDSETMFAFEELRHRASTHGRSSRDLLPGIP